jgi:hypothetical protein
MWLATYPACGGCQNEETKRRYRPRHPVSQRSSYAPCCAPIAPAAVEAAPAVLPEKRRKAPNRATVPVFLRISQVLYEQYDEEAVRRTKQTGRGVTVQQVILDRLAGARA